MTGCAIVDDSSGSTALFLTTEGRYGGEGIGANADELEDRLGLRESDSMGFEMPRAAKPETNVPFRATEDGLLFPSGETVSGIDGRFVGKWASFLLDGDRTVAYVVSNLPPELGDGYLNQYGMETIRRDEQAVRCGEIPGNGAAVPVCQFFKDGNTMVATGLPVESLTVVEGRRDLIGAAGIIPGQDGAQAAGA